MYEQSKTQSTGDRRSFCCRVKLGSNYSESNGDNTHENGSLTNENAYSQNKSDYKVVHFVGFLRFDMEKNLIPGDSSKHHSAVKDSAVQHYLIAYGQTRPKTNSLVNFEFVSKHDTNGKFVYVEPK